MYFVSTSLKRDYEHTESIKRDLIMSSDSPTIIKLIETPTCARPEKARRSARPKSVRWREITVLRREPTLSKVYQQKFWQTLRVRLGLWLRLWLRLCLDEGSLRAN